jgi:translation initiation factor IF-2
MKAPKFKDNTIGKVEIRQLFKISSLGIIAGSYVLEGVVNRNSSVKVMRGNEIIAESAIETLQQQKDEAKQVKAGFECGIKLKGFNDIKVGDILVVYENVKIN